MGRRLMRVIEAWDRRNQRWADRSEARRQRLPTRREVRTKDGSRFAVAAEQRGIPASDPYLGILLSVEVALALWFWLRHRLKYRGAWIVKVIALDERGFDEAVVRRLLVASKAQAAEAISGVSALLGQEGIAGLDTRIASGEYDAA